MNTLRFENISDGYIRVLDLLNCDMEVKRLFIVSPRELGVRGKHAHRECKQIIFCLKGSVQVRLFDGDRWADREIRPGSDSVFVRPMIWCEQIYKTADSEILVLCDQPYDETDYIRSFETFQKLRS